MLVSGTKQMNRATKTQISALFCSTGLDFCPLEPPEPGNRRTEPSGRRNKSWGQTLERKAAKSNQPQNYSLSQLSHPGWRESENHCPLQDGQTEVLFGFFTFGNRTGEQRCCSVPLFQGLQVKNARNSAPTRTHSSNLDPVSIVLFRSRCQHSQPNYLTFAIPTQGASIFVSADIVHELFFVIYVAIALQNSGTNKVR